MLQVRQGRADKRDRPLGAARHQLENVAERPDLVDVACMQFVDRHQQPCGVVRQVVTQRGQAFLEAETALAASGRCADLLGLYADPHDRYTAHDSAGTRITLAAQRVKQPDRLHMDLFDQPVHARSRRRHDTPPA